MLFVNHYNVYTQESALANKYHKYPIVQAVTMQQQHHVGDYDALIKCQLMDIILDSVPLMYRLIRALYNTCHAIKRLHTFIHCWPRLSADYRDIK